MTETLDLIQPAAVRDVNVICPIIQEIGATYCP